jgi:hypothetical protein
MGADPAAAAVIALFTSVLLVLAIWICTPQRQQSYFTLSFALTLTVALMVSYHLMPHDLSLLILPLLVIGDSLLSGELKGAPRSLFSVAAVSLFFTPLYLVLWFHFNRVSLMFLAVLLFALAISLVILRRDKNSQEHTPAI